MPSYYYVKCVVRSDVLHFEPTYALVCARLLCLPVMSIHVNSIFCRIHRYILACASREGKIAPGLFGPWQTNDAAGWNGDYTLNYNFQVCVEEALSLTLLYTYLQTTHIQTLHKIKLLRPWPGCIIQWHK